MRALRLFLSLAVLFVGVLGSQNASGQFETDPIASSAPGLAGFTFWNIRMNWCNHYGAQLFSDDFNGDGRVDMLCHDWKTGDKWIAFARPGGRFVSTDWHSAMRWCSHSTAQLFTGDFNRDGRADLLCHDWKTGDKWIAFARPGGFFEGTDWSQTIRWCIHSSAQLSVADYNGDGRADLMCHDVSSGEKWFAYSAF